MIRKTLNLHSTSNVRIADEIATLYVTMGGLQQNDASIDRLASLKRNTEKKKFGDTLDQDMMYMIVGRDRGKRCEVTGCSVVPQK